MRYIKALLALPALLAILALPVFPVLAAWEQKDLGTVQSLRGITQAGDALIAVGNSGNILRSTDGGGTWIVVDKNASVFWQDVAVSGGTVWVMGEGGATRQSTDNGVTWENVALGITQNVYDVQTFGNYGFLVGSGGRIMLLHPTARIWQTVASPTTVSLQRVQMTAEATAWIVGLGGVLLSTTDYGINWINKGQVASADLFGVWFTSPTTGYVVGKNGTFRKTTDAGVSWTDVAVSGLSSQTLYDIRVSGDRMIAVGDRVLLDSTDGGVTWTSTSYATENFRFYDVYFDAAGNVWVVGTQDDAKSVVMKWQAETEVPEEIEVTEKTETPALVEAAANSLIKLPCIGETIASDPCRSVYFYGSDGKRHAFPNEKVFFTWYDNFDSVVNVSGAFMSALPLGKNVTYHPGTRMVKFASVPTVYAVSKGGVLRAVASEAVASALYSADWNKKIDDISDVFYGNYTFGAKIETAADYDVAAEKTSVAGLDQNF